MLYVGRNADRRWNDVLAASSATSSKRTHGHHSTTALPVSSMPRRPARPGQLRVLPRRQPLVMFAGELGELLDHDACAPAC